MTNDAVRAEYDRLAPDYDRRWQHYVEASAELTLKHVQPQGGERVLDVGCGTGVLLERLSQIAPTLRLTGIDLSPAMLSQAVARVPPSVQLVVARAERLPFASCAFDVVVSSSVFHFIPEPQTALVEMARVLRSGGRLVLTDWCHDDLLMRIGFWWHRRRNPQHRRGYRQVELRRLLDATGWRHIEIERRKIDWFWGLMTATACRSDDIHPTNERSTQGGGLPPRANSG